MGTNPFDKAPTGTATKAKLAVANGDAEPTTVSSSADPFSLPSSGGGDYKFTDFLNELLLVNPISVETMATKIAPETEVVRVNVIRLDNQTEQVDDLLVFQTALIRNLKKVLRGPNEWVLGRLTMGAPSPGKNAPYILDKPTAEEIAQAKGVMQVLGLL